MHPLRAGERGGQGSCSLQKLAAARTNREAIATVRAGTVNTPLYKRLLREKFDLLKRMVFGAFFHSQRILCGSNDAHNIYILVFLMCSREVARGLTGFLNGLVCVGHISDHRISREGIS
jgi:hypothetical protein